MADGLSIEGGAVTENAPLLDLTQAWNASAETFTAILLNVTDIASATTSNLIDLQTNGTSKFKVDRAGVVAVGGGLSIDGGVVIGAATAVAVVDGASLRWADTARGGTIGYRINAGVVQYASGTLWPLGYQLFVGNGLGLQVDSTGTTTLACGQRGAVRVITAPGTVTVAGTDYVVVVNKSVGGATGVHLPAGQNGRIYVIKDGKGDAAVNNITITPAAGTIDGAATYVLNANYQSVQLVYNGAQWNLI